MIDLKSHLRSLAEPVPDWLRDFRPEQPFPREAFFQSRLVYYPGSGHDGHTVRLFGGSHSCHCFVQVDHGLPQDELEKELDDPQRGFRGYKTLARLQLSERDLVPNGWKAHLDRAVVPPDSMGFVKLSQYAFLEILQREPDYNEMHGPERSAVLFLGADGIASYDALFCQSGSMGAPFAVLLQDHGFGGNGDRFGAGGALERIVQRTGIYPQYILAEEGSTKVWKGYELVPEVQPDIGGMWANARGLYRWNGSTNKADAS
jgi:hypothetical protein